MNRKRKIFNSVAYLALLTAVPAFTQTPSDEATPETTAATPVARVYFQTDEGIYFYDAAANGALTLVKGSPFQTAGTWIEAARASFLFSLDGNRVHSYAFESNGTVGKQVDEIDTRDFDGADCGGLPYMSSTNQAVLDHTGKSLSVLVLGYAVNVEGGSQAVCSAYQSYQVSDSGMLKFNGAYVTTSGCCGDTQNLSFTGNDHFAYTVNATPAIIGFVRETNGELDHFNSSAEAPPSPPSNTRFGYADWTWQPELVEADPFGRVAVMGDFVSSVESSGRKLASYTVNSTGDLVTDNTYADLATPTITPGILNMSPSGKFLAAGGPSPGTDPGALQIFHFNGKAPITPYGGLLTEANDIYALHWDNNNHVYAIGDDQKLYVYTVTDSEIKQAPGSPYKFEGGLVGGGLIVIPKH